DNELSSSTDWTGAEVVIRKNDWTLDRCKINDHTGTKLTYTSMATAQDAIPGHGYFIQNDLRTLNKYGEWYHDTDKGKLYAYFGTAGPTGKTVKVATLNTLVYTSEYDYITLDDIHLTGSITNLVTCLNYISNYWTIKNSLLDFAGLDGIHLLGSNSTISNNLIYGCNQLGIRAVGNNEKITGNTIKNIGILPGQAFNGTYASGIFITNDNCLIKNNIIENVGYSGIKLSSTTDIITIQNNFINNVLLTLNDGGAIYVVAEGTSRLIDGNIIMNVVGNTSGTPYPTRHIARGIYLDVNSNNTIITNNTVAFCSEGGYMIHKSYSNRVENNTAYDNGYGMFFQNTSGSNIRNNTLKNNIFFAKGSSQLALKFGSAADDILSFGTADYNYYARPVDDDDVFHTYSPSTGSKYRTLADWQTFTGQDRNSKKSPVSVSDTSKIDFYYNPTTSNKTFSLAQPMIDVKGIKHTGTVTLLPYTSVILLPDPNPYTPPTPVFSNASIENNAPAALILNYSLSLATIVPSVNAFNVKVNGTTRPVNTVTISGSKITLTLASQVIYGDAVTVAYTKPASNPLQTSEGAQAASFSSQTVKNNCAAPSPTPTPAPIQPPVQQNQAPTISITSPVKGSSYTSPATVVIDVLAHDPDGSISSVALYNGNIRLGVLTAAPYTFTLKELEEGSFSLHAEATDNLNLTVKSASLEFHVTPFIEEKESFSLYPNPNEGRFTIDFSSIKEADNLKIAVHSMIGRTVYQADLTGNENTRQFDLSHIRPGIYVIMISANEIIHTQKFIKK
ncbi:MAG: right-handed parallel beta-helix repeat-containing protein, partial [Bacteroidales bacterium]|nr:right-handed parallel beta-helix repeat-containing protein [Bacteroidales bacterium]